MGITHSAAIVAVTAIVTAALRFLPFLIFRGERKTPEIVRYLGKVLPFAVMGMLVVYCYKGTALFTYPYGIPAILAGIVTALLHLWRRNTLLSIVTGTVTYMLLIRFL